MSERKLEPSIIGIGTANPPVRLTQEQTFYVTGYASERIQKIFLNRHIDFRHFYFAGGLNRNERSDELSQRYLRGATHISCRAIASCLNSRGLSADDVDFLAVCTCTGYVWPDLGSRLIAHMGFSNAVQRTTCSLGCAGAVPTLQRVTDFVRAKPHQTALMLALEICSACYYVDRTLETVVGNAICTDGAAAFLLSGTSDADIPCPRIIDSRALSTQNGSKKLGFNTGMEAANCPSRVDPTLGGAND